MRQLDFTDDNTKTLFKASLRITSVRTKRSVLDVHCVTGPGQMDSCSLVKPPQHGEFPDGGVSDTQDQCLIIGWFGTHTVVEYTILTYTCNYIKIHSRLKVELQKYDRSRTKKKRKQ